MLVDLDNLREQAGVPDMMVADFLRHVRIATRIINAFRFAMLGIRSEWCGRCEGVTHYSCTCWS